MGQSLFPLPSQKKKTKQNSAWTTAEYHEI